MKKETVFIAGLWIVLIIGSLLDTGTTDGIFIAATLGFFLLCVAYVEWCGRL